MHDRDRSGALNGVITICRRGLLMAVLAAAVLAFTALAGPASASAAEPETPCANPYYELPESPEKDPFYKPPAGFESKAPGTVLKSRCAVVPELPGEQFGEVNSYQLLFRSTNSHDEPIAAVTTIIVPGTPWTGLGERPFVAYTPAIDGLGVDCNPSYELREGSEGELAVAGPMLERGWEVDIPDFEGEDMEYGAGPTAARVTLDSIRAAYNFKPADVGPSNPLGTGGYSGGGQASAWTLEESHSYAPELHFTAGAPGGIPVDLNELAKSDDGTAGFSIVLAAAVGVDRGFPELGLGSLWNAEGLAAEKKLEKQCINEFVDEYPDKKFGEFTKPEYPEPLELPQVEKVLAADSLGTEPGMVNDGLPTSPVFLWQSKTDELVPAAGVERLANYYCSEGVDVTFDLGASGEHITYLDNAPAAIAYLEARFNGESVESTCGVNASENTKIDSGPSGKTSEDSATVTYSGEPDVAGTTFECKLDGEEFASCPESGVTYSQLAAGPHTFAVRSVSATGDKDVSPATQSFTVTGADVGVGISAAPNPVKVKKALTFTVTVTNAGPEAASGVVLTNTLAGSLKVRSAVSSQGTCTVPKRKRARASISCSLGALEAGAKDTVAVVVKPTEAGTVSDTSSVTDSGPPDRDPAAETATQKVTVEAKS